jgi:hypothetical protein
VIETILLGEVRIAVTRKAVKDVYLSVDSQLGQVTYVAANETSLEEDLADATFKFGWWR